MTATRRALGRRIVVTGLAGSGKSTLALALASEPSESEWREKQRSVLADDAWIAEGNYHETLDLRLEHAETVVVLDMPWWLCSLRALRRGLTMPDRLPTGCEYTRWRRLRDEWQLAGRIWRARSSEPARERAVISAHGTHVERHVLRSRREVNEFLEGLRGRSRRDDQSDAKE